MLSQSSCWAICSKYHFSCFTHHERLLQALETKQGHRQNFATIKERDDHLKKDMKLKEDGKRKLQDQIQDLQGQIQNIEASKSRLGQVRFTGVSK